MKQGKPDGDAIRIYKITQDDIDHPLICQSVEEVADFLREAEDGDAYVVRADRMSQAEYDSLPEWEGF